MILIYLPRPINSHNTIMRKGRLAVVFLGSIFPKPLKMHSQVKSLLTELNFYTYLHCDYLTYLFLITPTDCLLFLPHHAVTCRVQNNGGPERSKSVQNVVQGNLKILKFSWGSMPPNPPTSLYFTAQTHPLPPEKSLLRACDLA